MAVTPATDAGWLPALRPVTGTCSAWTATLARRAASPPPRRTVAAAAAAAAAQLQPIAGERSLQKAASEGTLPPIAARSSQPRPTQLAATKMLSGMSAGAKVQNLRNARGLEIMTQDSQVATTTKRGSFLDAKSPTSPQLGLPARFAESLEEACASVAEIRARHDAFEPGRSNHATKGGGKARRKKTSDDSALERLEAYKLVRKIQPPVPPLEKLPPEEMSLRIKPDQLIVKRNASDKQVNMWSPQKRAERVAAMNIEGRERREMVINQRDRMIARDAHRFTEVLLRKGMQAERVLLARKQRPIKQNELMEQTLSDSTLSAIPAEPAPDMVHFADDFEKVGRSARMVICFYRVKLQVRQRRSHARTVLQCMERWRHGQATVLTRLRRFIAMVTRLQRWWLRTSKRLKEMRNKVSQRWIPIERSYLQSPGTRSSVRGARPLTEKVRLRFIENELRARRYFLLPWIQRWEQDNAARLVDATPEEEAHVCTGIFRSQTFCPSYMPPAHPVSETTLGMGCPEWCRGRKGDADILDMVVRAQTTQGSGWRTVPTKGSGGQVPEAGVEANRHHDDEAHPFGTPVEDSELQRWGVDTEAMNYRSAGEDTNTNDEQVQALLCKI